MLPCPAHPQAALPFLGARHPAALHEAASALLLSLARLDQDAVWLMLFEAAASCSETTAAAPTTSLGLGSSAAITKRASGDADEQRGGAGGGMPGGSCVAITTATPTPVGPHMLPSLRQLLPPLAPATAHRRSPKGPAVSSSSSGTGGGGSGAWGVSAEVASDCAVRAQALLAQLEGGLGAAWHSSVAWRAPDTDTILSS